MNDMSIPRPLSPPGSPYTPDRMAPDFAALFEHAADGIFVVDAERLVVFANLAFARMVGEERASILGRSPADFIVSELESPPPQMEALHRDGSTLAMRGLRHSAGSQVPVEILSTLMADCSMLCIVRDTGRHSNEERRLGERRREVEAQMLLGQKMEAVGRLAGGVAHDFNNLLSVMLSAAESLSATLPAGSTQHEDVRDIRDAAERGAALTRQLLAFGRKEVRAPELLDLNAVVANVARLLQRALGAHIKTGIHRHSGPLAIVADPSQLEQVIVNLAINARDAMPDGGTLTVTTSSRVLVAADAGAAGVMPGTYVALTVRDNGVGMDEATRVRAFEPFFTTKAAHLGTGLGLSTVYGIARQSGGGVMLVSNLGEGTEVTILLPRAATSGMHASVAALSGEHAVVGPRGRVLLVEDEPRVRAQARRLLERSGYAVTDAPDGAEGVLQFRARRGEIDVVVSDVVMSTMGGVEMVAQLRAITPGLPVVFVSGYTANDRDLPLDDCTVFVPKPYTIDALCEAIDALIVR